MKILFPSTFYAATSPACGRGRSILPTKSSKYRKKRRSLLRRGPLACLRPVYKPHSVQRNRFRLGSHLSGRRVTAPLGAAYPELWGNEPPPTRPQTSSLLLGLAPGGGYLAARITARAGGLLHHRFTMTTPPHPRPLS